MERQKIGIALSGGGVKAAAHVGVLQFLKELGIEPQIFAGTSAGAVVGAMAAANYTPEEILTFFKSTNIFRFSNFAWRKPAWINTHKFEDSLKSFFPEDSFEALSKKLFVTTTDITNGKSEIFHQGELIKILMASSAYPVVFSPIEMNGVLYADGAILNNFPVEPLQGVADKIIGVNVHRRKAINNKEMTSSYKIFRRAYEISAHYAYFRKYKYCDVVIAPDNLSRFSTLRTNHTDEIFQIGYDTAKEQKDTIIKELSE